MPKKPVFARSIFESIVLLDTISNSFLLSPSLLLQSSHEPGSNRIVEGRISMKRQWTDDELEAHFTLHRAELDLVGDSKTDHNLLGAACLLKYFQHEGRFPSQKQDVPPVVIVHLAQQLGVVPEKIIPYDWEGRTIKVHRAA